MREMTPCAVNAMSSDPDRAREMGRIGRERAVAHFGWDAIAEQTIDVYRAALDREALVRPIGNTVYLMPPYIVSEAEIDHLGTAIAGAYRAAID